MGDDRHLISEGIILKIISSGEINRNFIFISPDMGIKTATAYGALKIKSRFCSVIQPFVSAKFYLYKSPKNDFYKLLDADNIKSNDYIRKNLSFSYLCSFYSEVLLSSYISDEEYKNYYYLILYSLDLLEQNNDCIKSFLFFTGKFLFLSGLNFNLNSCGKCKNEFKKYFFDFNEGSLFCTAHAQVKDFALTGQACLLWKEFLVKKFLYLKDIKIGKENFSELYPLIKFLLKNIFEKELKTFKFLNEIFI